MSPERRACGDVRRAHHGESEVAFGRGRPRGRGHIASFAASRALAVEQGVVRGLGTLDIETYEAPTRRTSGFREERAPAREMSLVEVDQPGEPELERRALGAEVQRVRCGDEIDVGQKEARLDPGHVER